MLPFPKLKIYTAHCLALNEIIIMSATIRSGISLKPAINYCILPT